jgi:hypothetical protein
MGNTAGKETRSPYSNHSHGERGYSPHGSNPNSPSYPLDGSQVYSSRNGRGSRSDLGTLLGFRENVERERDVNSLEARREAKAEREARRVERERLAREAERERSMRDEHVDGGYLVTQGVYTGVEDYHKAIVRQLMVETLFSSSLPTQY